MIKTLFWLVLVCSLDVEWGWVGVLQWVSVLASAMAQALEITPESMPPPLLRAALNPALNPAEYASASVAVAAMWA